ncbi:MAG TPA: hypothetical protein VFX30_10945, partial [bacterium]|nr:hypothetical protein [bacterium]
MGLEGPRLWTSATDVETTFEVPAEEIPATMTDGRADLTASTDSFLPGLLTAGPDVPARPAVGHPLFTCRFLTSEIPGTRPPSPGAEPANVEEVLQAFEDELGRFETRLEGSSDEATASLDQLECLALQLEALPADGLESEALRNRHIAVLRTWSVVRTATVRLSERLDHAPDVMVDDTGSSDRMRAAADRLVE